MPGVITLGPGLAVGPWLVSLKGLECRAESRAVHRVHVDVIRCGLLASASTTECTAKGKPVEFRRWSATVGDTPKQASHEPGYRGSAQLSHIRRELRQWLGRSLFRSWECGASGSLPPE